MGQTAEVYMSDPARVWIGHSMCTALRIPQGCIVVIVHCPITRAVRPIPIGATIDDAGNAEKVDAVNEMQMRLAEINQLGCRSPRPEQFEVLGYQVEATALMQLHGFGRRWEHLPPNQRRAWVALREAWTPQVERQVQQQLGSEPATTEAA